MKSYVHLYTRPDLVRVNRNPIYLQAVFLSACIKNIYVYVLCIFISINNTDNILKTGRDGTTFLVKYCIPFYFSQKPTFYTT